MKQRFSVWLGKLEKLWMSDYGALIAVLLALLIAFVFSNGEISGGSGGRGLGSSLRELFSQMLKIAFRI
jgi:hypothetical protein